MIAPWCFSIYGVINVIDNVSLCTGSGFDHVVYPFKFAILDPHMVIASCIDSRVTVELISSPLSTIRSTAFVVNPAVSWHLHAVLASAICL